MASDRYLIQIRERSFLDVLDLALVVVRSRPLPVVVAAAAGALPFAVLNTFLLDDPDLAIPLFLALLLMEAPWATAPLTVVLGGMMFGERPTAGKVVRTLLRGLPALFAYQFVLRAVLAATFFLYPLVPARLAFLDEVILLERGRFFSVVKRCSTLCGNRGGDLFGQWIAILAFGTIFACCFWAGTGAAVNSLTTSNLTWDEPGFTDLRGFRFQLGAWVAVSFFGVARFFTYIDQRIRLEGWEVKLRLQAVGAAMEEADRW